MDEHERLVRDEIAATIRRGEFRDLDIEEFEVELTGSFKRRLGECRRQNGDDDSGGGGFLIRIARRLFTDREDEQWRDTVAHEVAHAHVLDRYGSDVPPHGEEWKAAARRAGANPRARYEGVDESVDPNYVLACPNGCFERSYINRAKRVKNPWRYTCTGCDAKLISYDADERPDEPTPGTCYVESIPWNSPRYVQACPDGCYSAGYGDRRAEVETPSDYRCGDCGRTAISYPAGERPPDPTPGTQYLE